MNDAQEVFERYANDAEVTKYMSWPRHETVATTEQVVESWVEQWRGDLGGALLIEEKSTGRIIGSTGLDLQNKYVASTGYVLARNSWGKGYATEALQAIVELAHAQDLKRLFAYCHFEHALSARVLEKGGFEYEGRLRNYMEFPNLSPGEVTDVFLYAWVPPA